MIRINALPQLQRRRPEIDLLPDVFLGEITGNLPSLVQDRMDLVGVPIPLHQIGPIRVADIYLTDKLLKRLTGCSIPELL